jgi:hypothetical protein
MASRPYHTSRDRYDEDDDDNDGIDDRKRNGSSYRDSSNSSSSSSRRPASSSSESRRRREGPRVFFTARHGSRGSASTDNVSTGGSTATTTASSTTTPFVFGSPSPNVGTGLFTPPSSSSSLTSRTVATSAPVTLQSSSSSSAALTGPLAVTSFQPVTGAPSTAKSTASSAVASPLSPQGIITPSAAELTQVRSIVLGASMNRYQSLTSRTRDLHQGFLTEWFVLPEEMLSDYTCGICREVLCQAVEPKSVPSDQSLSSNGRPSSVLYDEMDQCIDLFCATCLGPWLSTGKQSCPVCRRMVPGGRMNPAIRERVRIG